MSVMIRIYENLSTKFSNLVNSSKTIKLKISSVSTKYSSFFKSRNCQLCDEALSDKAFFCNGCDQDLPRIQTKCSVCCLPLNMAHSGAPGPRLVCGECLTSPPSFTMTICPFRYEFPISELIRHIKYSKQRYWIKTLCQHFKQAYLQTSQNDSPAKPDLLIPIPIHKSKRKERGYNQAELIASTLSKGTGIAISKSTLIKTKATETQAQLNKQERMKNLSGSFSISKKESKQGVLVGKHVALIDDVMTTKATCELASKLLLEHGAKRVDVWCLARTPKMK